MLSGKLKCDVEKLAQKNNIISHYMYILLFQCELKFTVQHKNITNELI